MTPLPRTFFQRDPVTVARDLLGKQIVRRSRAGTTQGRIVETEAYLGGQDPAAHSYRGMTPRNRVMFGPAGMLYVYAIHARFCMNAVTGSVGDPTAVLIRAAEPLAGVRLMRQRRRRTKLLDLTRGPARLCEAFDVDRELNGWDLTVGRRIWLCDEPEQDAVEIRVSPRIGVTSGQNLPLRFFVAENPYVSGPRNAKSAALPRR